ncbi:DUF3800 domain-containing protein, partial [Sinirhodobacter populi]
MHLFYVDESGSVADPSQKYFALAGVAIFERKTHWVEQELNTIATKFNDVTPHSIELHGSPMRSGRDGWKTHPLVDRLTAIKDALQNGVAKSSSNDRSTFWCIAPVKICSCYNGERSIRFGQGAAGDHFRASAIRVFASMTSL